MTAARLRAVTEGHVIALRDAASRAINVAHLDDGKLPHEQRLWASREGLALATAFHELTGIEALHDLIGDIERELGIGVIEEPSGREPIIVGADYLERVL